MATEIKVPTLGESVTSATVARWLKQAGEAVAADEPLVELETDKVTVEVNAPSAGTLSEIAADEGAEVDVGALLGVLVDGAAAPTPARPLRRSRSRSSARPPTLPPGSTRRPRRPARSPARRRRRPTAGARAAAGGGQADGRNRRRPGQLGEGTGKDGRITKGDVLAFLSRPAAPAPPAPAAPSRRARPPRARNG